MDSEILFLLIFFVFAVLQSIGQKRKQAGRQGGQPPAGEEEGSATSQGLETSQGRERAQAASRERSEAVRGERAEAERRERVQVTPQRGSGAPPRTKGPERTSEGLIPGDIWEEILGLARGEAAPPTAPGERPPSSPPPPPAREEAEPRWPAKPRGEGPARRPAPQRAEGRTRWTPVSVAAEPSVPPRALEEMVPRRVRPAPVPSEQPDSRPGKSVRAGLFGDGSARDLQKAVVLKEVLGPPVALRE